MIADVELQGRGGVGPSISRPHYWKILKKRPGLGFWMVSNTLKYLVLVNDVMSVWQMETSGELLVAQPPQIGIRQVVDK